MLMLRPGIGPRTAAEGWVLWVFVPPREPASPPPPLVPPPPALRRSEPPGPRPMAGAEAVEPWWPGETAATAGGAGGWRVVDVDGGTPLGAMGPESEACEADGEGCRKSAGGASRALDLPRPD